MFENLAHGVPIELGNARKIFLVPAAFFNKPGDLGRKVHPRRRYWAIHIFGR
jgi:hypothetical protein